MGSPSKLRPRWDSTHYPIEDDVGEGSLQRFIAELLRPLVERWLASRGALAFVGADQFVYYEQHNPKKCVSPDVYVVPGEHPGQVVGCWKTWETARPPSFAVEIVSGERDKDYLRGPVHYADAGFEELILFDPERGPGRLRFQVYRRLARRGFVCVAETNADRVRSRVLGCWIRAVGAGESLRLRLATGARGDDLVPTEAEAERRRADDERRRADDERRRADDERAARLRAEAELVALRSELGARKRR